ncbi:hypothetical protein ACV229_30370 [Burkholderia sp. MR1-5-21]
MLFGKLRQLGVASTTAGLAVLVRLPDGVADDLLDCLAIGENGGSGIGRHCHVALVFD